MKTVTLRAARPWTQLNEYEGELDVELEGVLLTCYTMLPRTNAWAKLVIGARMDVDLWLDRRRTVAVLTGLAAVEMVALDETIYETVGRILAIDGDDVLLATRFELRVDLDSSPGFVRPEMRVGELLRVVGQLKIDLDSDPE